MVISRSPGTAGASGGTGRERARLRHVADQSGVTAVVAARLGGPAGASTSPASGCAWPWPSPLPIGRRRFRCAGRASWSKAPTARRASVQGCPTLRGSSTSGACRPRRRSRGTPASQEAPVRRRAFRLHARRRRRRPV